MSDNTISNSLGSQPQVPILAFLGVLFAAAVTSAQPPIFRSIPEIQGEGHFSPFNGSPVETSGIVTATASDGFYLQDPTGDGNDATSDGIFVFTSSFPSVVEGDSINLTANVFEFQQSGRPRNLTLTQLTSPSISVLSTGNVLPTPTTIGPGGRAQPDTVIEDDAFTSFDPDTDGIDFYESLEGMRVAMPNATAVTTTTFFGEIWAVPGFGATTVATGMNSRGGITIGPNDFNPERIQIDDGLIPSSSPVVNIGDSVANVVGVIGYAFGAYKLNVTQPVSHTGSGGTRESSTIQNGLSRLTVASYNVLNLDPFDGASKFNALGLDIAGALNSPDIIALQEIQDSDGPSGDVRLDANDTYAALISAIELAGGPTYSFAEVPPPTSNIDGGQPTGNIRVGYLYNPNRVDLVNGSLIRHGDGVSAFNESRKPLQITFQFNGEEVTLINNHFASKSGSTGLYENVQPPVNGNENKREQQAAFVADLVDQILTGDPDAKVIVLGDLNEFSFSTPLAELTGGVSPALTNLEQMLDPTDRYTFVFDGNSQALDHILVTDSLLSGVEFDAVHINSGVFGASDHDPLLASFLIPVPEPSTWVVLLGMMAMICRRNLVVSQPIR